MYDENHNTPIPPAPEQEPNEVVSWYVRPDEGREVKDCYVQPRPMPAPAVPAAAPEKKPHSRRGLWVFLVIMAVLVGAGHLGQALLSYGEFAHYGLKIAAAFDNNPDLQGSSIHGCPVYGMDMLPIVCQQNSIPIGIITTPAQYAQDVCDQLVAAGCKAIWNFAHVHLYVPEGTLVQNEDMAVSFALLSNRLAKTMRTGPEEA